MAGSIYSDIGGNTHRPEKIIVHENYNSNTHDYDVAVVQVSISFNVSIHNYVLL
jgi:hypothetical protein